MSSGEFRRMLTTISSKIDHEFVKTDELIRHLVIFGDELLVISTVERHALVAHEAEARARNPEEAAKADLGCKKGFEVN